MPEKIGIARALYFYYHFPLFKTFFEGLGCEVVISPKTNKAILQTGIEHSPPEICLPVKAFIGHITYLVDKVDYIFIPRITNIKESRSTPGGFGCPKAICLPDLIRAIFESTAGGLPLILELNWDERITDIKTELTKIARILKQDRKADFAFCEAQRNQLIVDRLLTKGLTPDLIFEGLCPSNSLFLRNEEREALRGFASIFDDHYRPADKIPKSQNRFVQSALGGPRCGLNRLLCADNRELLTDDGQRTTAHGKPNLTVGVIGHPYLLFDDTLSLGIIEKLKKMGVSVITPSALGGLPVQIAHFALQNGKGVSWFYEQAILGSAAYLLRRQRVSGLLLISSFACGTSAVVNEIIQRELTKSTNIPLLILLLDEHTAEAGIMTRLESFIDCLNQTARIGKQ
uniref:DUF2229 domain-containing protein n=1 Tax=candidate division WOR-3 bacterium TaxID=2052148 RepID=A0A7C6AAH9_UNCW3